MSETRVDLQGRIFYRPCPRYFHEEESYLLRPLRRRSLISEISLGKRITGDSSKSWQFLNFPSSFRNNCSLHSRDSSLHEEGITLFCRIPKRRIRSGQMLQTC